MDLQIDRLPLSFAFHTAYGETRDKQNLLVTVRDGVREGYGEVLIVDPPSVRYPLTEERVLEEIARNEPSRQLSTGLSIASLDLLFKQEGVSLADRTMAGLRSYLTLPIISPISDAIARRDGLLAMTPLLKIKVNGDAEYCKRVLDGAPPSVIIDANGSWTPDLAMDLLPHMPPLAGIEQPFPHPHPAWRSVHDAYALRGFRFFADETIVSLGDMDTHAGLIEGIVIKLDKQGGMKEAYELIHKAHIRGLRVVMGCNLVSTLGISAVSLLAPMADYIDLDAVHFLEKRTDPFEGTIIAPDGGIIYSTLPGIARRKM